MLERNREISNNEESVSIKIKRRKVDYKPYLIEMTYNTYTMGWVCALLKEQTVVTAMLD